MPPGTIRVCNRGGCPKWRLRIVPMADPGRKADWPGLAAMKVYHLLDAEGGLIRPRLVSLPRRRGARTGHRSTTVAAGGLVENARKE